MSLNLLLAKLVDSIFQQGLENLFSVLDILRKVTFRLVMYIPKSPVPCSNPLHVYESALAGTVRGKCQHRNSSNPNMWTCSIKLMVLFITKVVLVKGYVCVQLEEGKAKGNVDN